MRWGGLTRGKTLQRMVGCAMWAELGERVYAEGENDEGESWGNAEETRGNKNPAEPWGLRDERSNNIIY